METVQYLVSLLATIALGLSGWVLKKVANQGTELAAQESRLNKQLDEKLAHQNQILSEVRDMVMGLRQAVTGTSSSDGLLDQFARFTDRYEERSQKTEALTSALDKRLALVELHLQYVMPKPNDLKNTP